MSQASGRKITDGLIVVFCCDEEDARDSNAVLQFNVCVFLPVPHSFFSCTDD